MSAARTVTLQLAQTSSAQFVVVNRSVYQFLKVLDARIRFIRPFSLALRLFVAMTAGHVLMKVLAGFVINGLNAEAAWVPLVVSIPSFILMIGITLLELLVCAIQAYVFALLTSLYINDAVNLH